MGRRGAGLVAGSLERMRGSEWERQKVTQGKAGSNERKCACRESELMIKHSFLKKGGRGRLTCWCGMQNPLWRGPGGGKGGLLSRKQNHDIKFGVSAELDEIITRKTRKGSAC